ncbi:hypothetical protein PHYPSEUDO_009219 [Phytophthora pseudosyringae]|uniref:SAM domain-containing protein n=1 Tax=Phytophthora pseudosyringae TaxID=221518 RepID=A0A8T1W9M4_9STRA|nr:hypothetical protein PHYPSEUDO_009219 [Phytophthora pseudosyringae]
MDWEANLAAIIKCTDASLAQQFRQFEDVTAEFATVEEGPAHAAAHDRPGSDNVAAAYLRDTMATEYRHRQQQEPQQQQTRSQTPSYSRVSDAFTRGPATSAATFSEHFHRRRERKRATTGRVRDNQRVHRRASEYEFAEDEGQGQDHEVDEPRFATARPAGGAYHQQMYSSPTYDVAQMMEQVRLSLKLEVDARAAIAERQLSALLQLCKATSEELDRLRVEVCANDRQLHTLDQVQSKIRQELTTQKDIGFHLQSICGKDESWRMQTENQLLELRQMAAALREQGNSTQVVAQEKLSRSELLVQFNAAMEPIKAQIQANLQHQAQQIADITRTTSSSSLLLDGITQKVNRGMTEELNELRSDLSALKHHVAKMDIFQDGGRGEGLHGRTPQPSKEEIEAKAKEDQQQQEKRLAELRDGLQKELLALVKDYVDGQTKPIRLTIDESTSRFVGKQDMEHLRSSLDEACRSRSTTTVMQLESQIKSTQDQIRGEYNAVVRDTSDRIQKSVQQTASSITIALDGQVNSWRNKQLDFVKMVEKEQKERKQALDELHESARKSRHQLEDQLHSLEQESRTTLSQHGSDHEKRLKDVEKQIESAVADAQKENQAAVVSLKSSIQVQGTSNTAELERKMKRLEETVSSVNVSVAALSKSIASSTTSSSESSIETSTKGVSVALEKQTSVYVSTMENLLQKMQLQLQLQAQPQVQMTMAPSPYHGFWPPSPYAAGQAPPPPLLHLPSTVNPSSADQPPSTPTTAMAAKHLPSAAPASSSGHARVDKDELDTTTTSTEEQDTNDKSADRVRGALPVKQPEPLSTIATPLSCPTAPPPAVSSLASTLKARPDQGEQQSSERNVNEDDEKNKRENSFATTAKGALAEAELAKARVENRRKQEQETKQQQQRQPPVPVNTQKSPGTGVSISDIETGSCRSSVPVVLAAHTPVLTRSASSSALPGKDSTSHPVVSTVGNNAMTPASSPSSSIPIGVTRILPNAPPLPVSVPPRSMTKVEEAAVATVPAASTFTTSSHNSVKSDSKPPLAIPVASSAPPAAPTREVVSADPPPAQLPSKDSTPSIPQSSVSATPRRNTTQDVTLSIPSPRAKDEAPPPLSPLAKIFARPTPDDAAQADDEKEENLAPAQSVSNISPAVDPVKIQEKDPSPSSSTSTGCLPVLHVECKFCDDEIDSSKLDDHEQNCDWKPKRCQHCNMVVISRDLLRHETSCKTNVKSCPHCNKNMPQSALTTHASRCSKRPIKCIRCCQLFPADTIVAHSTNCKVVLGVNQANSLSPQQTPNPASRAPIKIPPPPPFPPPSTATTPVHTPPQNTRRASADSKTTVPAEETASDRLARRNLALSQLTSPVSGTLMQHERNTAARASAPSPYSTTTSGFQTRPILQPDGVDEDEEEDEEEEYDDEDDDDELTLAQVVKEWNVENVCLWLHEDVGVPDVVLRFQQKQCNGEMLLELTESELINDFGVKDRVQRERILSAIEAINTSNAFSDEDEEDDDDDDEDDLEESVSPLPRHPNEPGIIRVGGFCH